MSINTIAKTLNTLRNRLSPSSDNRPTATSKSTSNAASNRPTDRLYAQVVHSSTPANSLDASPGDASPTSHLEDQDPETSLPQVEEVRGTPPSRSRPPSQDSIDDGRPINDRLQEIRSLVATLQQLKPQKDYQSRAPPLHKKLVDKIHSLLDYTALMDVESTFRPELLDHAEMANQIRLTFTDCLSQNESQRRRSNSLDGNMFSTLPPTNGTRSSPEYTSQFAQDLRRQSMAPEANEEVFSPNYLAQGPQTGQSPEFQTRDRNFSSDSHVSITLDRLFERLGEAEAKWEQDACEMKSNMEGIKGTITAMGKDIRKLQRQAVRATDDIQSIQQFNKVEFHQTVKGLWDRCCNLESMPAPASVAALRIEVSKLQQELAGVKVGQDVALNPKLGNVIANSLQAFRSSVINPLSTRVSNLENNKDLTNLSGEIAALKTKVDGISPVSPAAKATTSPEACPYSMQIRDMMSRVVTTNRHIAKLREEVKKLQAWAAAPPASVVSTALVNTQDLSTSSEAESAKSLKAGGGNLKFLQKELTSKIMKIRDTVTSDKSWKSDFQEVKRVYATDCPRLAKLIDQVTSVFTQISRSVDIEEECYNDYRSTLDEADLWLKELDSLHHQVNVAASGQLTNTSNLANPITPFSANASQNVYEFLADFEAAYLHVGNSKQRAERLYKHHLAESVRLSCLSVSGSYPDLRALLLSKYGNVNFILNQMFTVVETTPKLSGSGNAARLNYFSQWTRFFFRVDQLCSHESISKEDVDRHLSSVTGFDKLLTTLPEQDEATVISRLRDNGINTDQPRGAPALRLLRTYIREKVEDLHRLINRRELKPPLQSHLKPKPITVTQASSSNAGEESPSHMPSVTATQASSRTSQWWTNGLAFPCPLVDHDHEIASCPEFLSMTPAQRRNDARNSTRRVCWACLKPFSSCRKKCLQDTRISEILKCAGCVEASKGKDIPPMTVLFCTNPDHEKQKPKAAEVFKELKKYLKNLAPTITENTIVFSNLSFVLSSSTPEQTSHKEKPPVKSRKADPESLVSMFESSSGDKVGFEERSSIKPLHDACLLLQIVKIGKTQCLLMFDRGANINLIDGDVAEREELCVLTQDSTTINVAGGNKLSSEYGKYLLKLGAADLGWHSLVCHGMPEVTVKFPKYDLTAINYECQQTFGQSWSLPAFTGGASVALLIGIQNVSLDPVRIGILPSGVGVFQSPFKDIFGSNICYAGPHQSFTEANRANQFTTSAIALFISSCQLLSSEINDNPHLFGGEVEVQKNDSQGLMTPYPCPGHIMKEVAQKHGPSVLKALIPNSKLREIQDQEDFSDNVNFRCPECSECQNCRKSSKVIAMSRQDAREQLAIERSVEIRLSSKEVWVDLPFVIDPVKFLSKRHNGTDNYRQALKVYLGQCRKPEHIKEGIRKTHKDLVSQGFISKLSSMPEDIQQLIKDAPFRHYFPFRSVCKEDSKSTPVRLVVDPTMTGLNLCLPKGENKIAKIFDILITARCHPFLWSTDIGKMYNRLKVKPSSLAYQLLLFDDSLDPTIPPEVWVLTSAWYGVVNTGNQASAAIDALVELCKHQFPNAVAPLKKSRYVDDVAPGAWSKESRDAQINDVQQLLEKGGFPLKYIVKSGELPPESAALGEGFTKLLGYKFFTKPDLISTAKQYVEGELDMPIFSRRWIASKVAELFDPIGIMEPVRVQLKLHMSELKGLEWGEALSEEMREKWLERLKILEIPPKVEVPRFVGIPQNGDSQHLRLICLSDASKVAGGSAIYAGFKQPSGNFSVQLLTAKSKLLDASVPRNELSAIMYTADLALQIKRLLGSQVKEILYATDSSIALAWCHNSSLKLRLFVYNRVEAIRRMINWTVDDESLPLYHIRRELNLADWVTKLRPITVKDIDAHSPWQKGLSWMSLPTDQLPVSKFSKVEIDQKLQEEIAQECHNEPHFLDAKLCPHPLLVESQAAPPGVQEKGSIQVTLTTATNRPPLFIDIIGLGWFRARRNIAKLIKFGRLWRHKTHKSQHPSCAECTGTKIEGLHAVEQDVDSVLFRHESLVIKSSFPKKKLVQFVEDSGILYYCGRFDDNSIFSQVDLDAVQFLDAPECFGRKPVVLVDSEIFYAYLIAVHMTITPHTGNAATARQINRRMFIPSNANRIIQKLRNDCSKCRLLMKKTVELEMKKHHFARTMIAPVFYNSMIDIAYGFPGQAYLKARKRVDIYALVIVCILSGATDILALESLETQNVVQALERHSARHGVPAHIFIDNGTQLKALKTANFRIQDVNTHVFEAMGIQVSVSNPKAHEERGRVERRIGLIRRTLERSLVGTKIPVQTSLQWETVFAKIANTIDNLPLAKGNSDTHSHFGFEILTANRLKLGRNNFRSLAGEGIHVDMPSNLSKILERNRHLYHTWYQLFIDEIQDLNLRPLKWCTSSRLPMQGDTVFFVLNDPSYQKNDHQWKLGKVLESSNQSVVIEYYPNVSKTSKLSPRTIVRNPRDVAILFSLNEMYPNSKEYFLANSKEC